MRPLFGRPGWGMAFTMLWVLPLAVWAEGSRKFWLSMLVLTGATLVVGRLPWIKGQRMLALISGVPFLYVMGAFAIGAAIRGLWLPAIFFGLVEILQAAIAFAMWVFGTDGFVEVQSDGLFIRWPFGIRRRRSFSDLESVSPYRPVPLLSARYATVRLKLKRRPGLRGLLGGGTYHLAIPPEDAPSFIAEVSERIRQAKS